MLKDHVSALLTMALFAVGAVAIILYQHASATAQITSALGASPNGSAGTGAGGGLASPASLAGTPTVGQSGSSVTPAVVPLNIQPGYLLN